MIVILTMDLVKNLLDAHLSSQEEAIFGNFLEGLAIFINGKVYGGKKSSAEGIDLEFDKDRRRYIISIKSGPNWGNSSQIKKLRDNFKRAKRILRTSKSGLHIVAINGCCYGRDDRPDKGDYFKYCGQRFWELISANQDLYIDIIKPLGHKAKEKNEELVRMDKIKSEFLDTVSHELRTPLTSIIGYSRLLLDGIQGEMSEKQTNYIERIWARGMHQLQLINDVLDFSKLNSGRTTFMMEPVSVVAILADTAEDEMPLAKQKGHELILEVPDGISDVHVDKMRLKQVLTNIINNAIKFTPDNGRIVIKADNADEMVKISIIDNGIGIKEENMGKIFDNFIQVDQSNSRIYGGTGLGLAIARDLVKHMGGRIDAESEYGKGSIFNIFMPQDTPSNISKYPDTLD